MLEQGRADLKLLDLELILVKEISEKGLRLQLAAAATQGQGFSALILQPHLMLQLSLAHQSRKQSGCHLAGHSRHSVSSSTSSGASGPMRTSQTSTPDDQRHRLDITSCD